MDRILDSLKFHFYPTHSNLAGGGGGGGGVIYVDLPTFVQIGLNPKFPPYVHLGMVGGGGWVVGKLPNF